MPKRTQSHVVADIAVARVVSIFTDLGWACQTVEHDYGEDVFVQPAVNESADPFRLWVQVKGTQDVEALKNKHGRFVWKVSHDHVLRWLRSLETVVVVLWDIKTNRGFWMSPREEFTEWECFLRERKQASLLFKESNLFQRTSANKLIWEARFAHYSLLLMQARAAEARVLQDRQDGLATYPDFKSSAPTLALDLLRLLEFTRQGKVSSQLRGMVERTAKRLIGDDPNLGVQAARDASLTLVVLFLAHKKCPDLGLPANVLHEVTTAAEVAINVTETSDLISPAEISASGAACL